MPSFTLDALEARKSEIRNELAQDEKRASLKIAAAIHLATEKIGAATEKIEAALTHDDQARADWEQVEREASYGYAARTQFPQFTLWTLELEYMLRDDWAQLKNVRSWDEACVGVRQGWVYSNPPKS